jgi:hypothetical protein
MTVNKTREQVTQAFDNIVNIAWGSAKASEAGQLSVKQTYKAIDEIQAELTKVKQILYTRTEEVAK